jgi:Uma2 family endonuclease
MHEIVSEKPWIEYLDGERFPKVSPRLKHMVVQGNLTEIVRRCAGERGLSGPELHVYPGRTDGTETILVPDVSFVSWERLDALGDEREEPHSPDIAIEVRSPSNDLRYLERKIARYLATGTLLVLDVDPKQRSIVAHDAEGTRCFSEGERFERSSVQWLSFDLADAFANVDRVSRYDP